MNGTYWEGNSLQEKCCDSSGTQLHYLLCLVSMKMEGYYVCPFQYPYDGLNAFPSFFKSLLSCAVCFTQNEGDQTFMFNLQGCH